MNVAQIAGLLLLFPIWVITGVMVLRVLGKLVESLYTSDRGLWTDEGKPWVALSWEPPEGRSASGNIASTFLAIKLAFSTPTWLSLIAGGSLLQKKLRIFLFLEFVAVVVIFSLILSLNS